MVLAHEPQGPRRIVAGRAYGQLRGHAFLEPAAARIARRHGHVRGKRAQNWRHPRRHQSRLDCGHHCLGPNRCHAQYCRAARSGRLCRRAGRSHAGRRTRAGCHVPGARGVRAHRDPCARPPSCVVPVFFMAGLYRGKNNYHVVFEQVADFSAMSVGSRDLAVRAAIERYAAVLDRYCRSDPYNWFNFFDFWRRPAGQRGE